jgi:hypothetical protein
MNKIKVLVFIDWYLPGYKAGGPIQSVANIISQLKAISILKLLHQIPTCIKTNRISK